MSTEQEDCDNGVTSQQTIVLKPSKMTFHEYDKKMRAFRPDLEYWDLVLTEYKAWDNVDENGDPVYTETEQRAINKADTLGNGPLHG